MTVTPGASLDAAIAGISRGVDNARKVASEINKDAVAKTASSSSSSSATSSNSTSTLGGNIDVKA